VAVDSGNLEWRERDTCGGNKEKFPLIFRLTRIKIRDAYEL
jgi:hypothetical protein